MTAVTIEEMTQTYMETVRQLAEEGDALAQEIERGARAEMNADPFLTFRQALYKYLYSAGSAIACPPQDP